jgi:NhaP-type Na+/H+ or K+/H+ antiporter
MVGAVILVSALLSGLIERSGLPQVAVFLGMGAIIGPAGLNLFNAEVQSPMLRVVATLSLVLVLFTDAVSLNLKEVRKHWLLSTLVLGPGTLVSAVLVATLSWWMLGLDPAAATILGAALASTDPVLLRGLLQRPGVHTGVRQALRLEGGMNDAVLLPMLLVGMTIVSQGRALTGNEWGSLAVKILILSPAAGVLIAMAAIGTLQAVRKRIGIRRDYESIYSLGVAFAAFAAAESVHGSGFLAAFAAGLTISALDVELCDCFLEYGETTAEMALMFTFVLFGTSLIWTGLTVLSGTTVLFTFAVFGARMVSFVPALIPAKLTWNNRLLIAWFGPRGLSSLLLVLLPVFAGQPGSERLLTVCCLVVLFSVVMHGLSPMLLVKKPATLPGIIGEGASAAGDPEYITIDEVKPAVTVIDSRSERTYVESTEEIPGAFRVHPDRTVADATRFNVPKSSVLAVLCA